MRPKERRRIGRERRSDEDSLYYILERDLDREAILRSHDGWYSQVPLGRRKRIDYVVRYGDGIYGIEVKTGLPDLKHFEQVEKYRSQLDGVFLAYPSDRAGEAFFLSENRKKYTDVGLISLTLFRSHIIRKSREFKRAYNSVLNDTFSVPPRYTEEVREWDWDKYDNLPATVLKDGCLWVSYYGSGKYDKTTLHQWNLARSAWIGLGLLYIISSAISLDKYFSFDYILQVWKETGLRSFDLWPWVLCNILDVRTYGERAWSCSFYRRGHYHFGRIVEALKANLKRNEWRKLRQKRRDLMRNHLQEQKEYRREFVFGSDA